MIDELTQLDCEILIVDKNREAYIADVLNEQTIRKLVPPTVDAAIIDLGDNTEASILVTNYLKKIGVAEIIAKAESDEHGEILEIVGATRVIFPNREAAKRLTPLIAYSNLFNYMPISEGLIIAEVEVPTKFIGKTLVETDFRRTFRFNVIAIRKSEEEHSGYRYYEPEYRLHAQDVLLVAGNEEDLSRLVRSPAEKRSRGVNRIFHRLLRRDHR